ncbi:MAG: DUF4097 domain-containing protein [Candidatus Azobacteroides sp.]|nr:DUF4097 domain-containing protein [Candidatus Azobacteroides sp.]
MKKLFVLFACILLCATFFTVHADEEEKSPFLTRTFPTSSIKEVESATAGGSLTLTGNTGSEAIIEMYISRDNWSTEKIKQVLDENYTVDIRVENGKLYAVAKQKRNAMNWNSQGLSISFNISVPKQVNSNLQTSGGSIRISNVSGLQNLQTSGGSLTVENVSGNTAGMTSGGSITVTESKDNINLQTSGGSITAKDCSGKIDLKTSGGSISLSNLSGNINAATSGGSVMASDIKGTLKTGTSGGSVRLDGISGNLDAYTSGGGMDVRITSVSDYVKLSNSGSLSLSLPAGKGYNLSVRANKIETSGLKDFRGNMENSNIEGTVGNGGPEINVRSSQRVRLSFE